MRACWPKRHKEKKGPWPNFGSSFYMFFLLPLGLPSVIWGSQEGCLFYLRSSFQSSDLPLFYFHGLFPPLSFSHCHSGLLFPIIFTFLFTFYLLTWTLSWQSSHKWGALRAGLCGPVIRASGLGTKTLLLASAHFCVWPKSRETVFRKLQSY